MKTEIKTVHIHDKMNRLWNSTMVVEVLAHLRDGFEALELGDVQGAEDAYYKAVVSRRDAALIASRDRHS